MRREFATWSLSRGALGVVAVGALSTWLPSGWLEEPGSPLPILLALCGLAALVASGLATGRVLRNRQLSRATVEVERAVGLGAGDLRAALEFEREQPGSVELAGLQRLRVARALEGLPVEVWFPDSRRRLARTRRRTLSALAAAAFLVVLSLAEGPRPVSALATQLGRPWIVTFPPPPPPMTVHPAGAEIMRGKNLRVRVTAPGRERVILAWSPAGEPIRRVEGAVIGGETRFEIGPVQAPVRYWAEDGRGLPTDTFTAVPLDPLAVVSLQVTLDYPAWLDRPAERLTGAPTELVVPARTAITFRGRTNYDVRWAALLLVTEEAVDTIIGVRSARLEGQLSAEKSGRLVWRLEPANAVPGIRHPPDIELTVAPDRAPSVRFVSPARDVTVGQAEAIPLVVEARDDRGVRQVDLVWWRERAGGTSDARNRRRIDRGQGLPIMVLRTTLDPETAELAPGAEIAYYAAAADANPAHGVVVSDTFRVRLATLAEQRSFVQAGVEGMADRTSALESHAEQLENLTRAAERRTAESRFGLGSGPPAAEQTDYASTEAAREVLRDARDLQAELDSATAHLAELRARMERSAVLDGRLEDDLKRLDELYREIRESGLGKQIAALDEALRSQDRSALQASLGSVARELSSLEKNLERAVALLESAAVEQSLEQAPQGVADVADGQRALAARERVDRSWAKEEARLAEQTSALSADLADLERRLEGRGDREVGSQVGEAKLDVDRAATRMDDAARVGSDGGAEEQSMSGAASELASSAAAALERAERRLATAGENLRRDWKEQALAAIDRATAEALDLAREETELVRRLKSGSRSRGLAGRQQALREGLDNLAQSLAEAGARTALIDRRSGAAVSRTAEAMERVSRALAGGAQRESDFLGAGEEAAAALTDLAGSLVQSRQATESASSATGLEEALERLSRLGRGQANLNGETGELFMFIQQGRDVSDRLRHAAARQGELARELKDLGQLPGADGLAARPQELASEAGEIAERLAAGEIEQDLLDRQERLFRRLLDAGRLLRRDEEDPLRRESETARWTRSSLRIDPGPDGSAGALYPYPADSELEGLGPAQRRMVYEYFDRLNRRAGAEAKSP